MNNTEAKSGRKNTDTENSNSTGIPGLENHIAQVQGMLGIFELSRQKRRLNKDELLAVQVLNNIEGFLEGIDSSPSS